jgi:hypothetical protein
MCYFECLVFHFPPWVTLAPTIFLHHVSFLNPHPSLGGCVDTAGTIQRGFRSMGIGNQILCPQDPGSFHGSLQPDMAVKPTEDLRTAQIPEAGVSPEEELSEAGKVVSLLRSGEALFPLMQLSHGPNCILFLLL